MRQTCKHTLIVILLSLNLLVMSALLVIFVPGVSAATGCFPDTNGHWAEEFICWLSDNGIASGYPDGTYRPESPITRAEMAVMVKNLADKYESRIAALEALLESASLENSGQDLVFTGVNLHVRSGGGATSATNGLGNLIVGYNEDEWVPNTRSGSHNLVVGDNHTYSSYGGIVGGQYNSITGEHASVLGGSENIASGDNASISGGYHNTANGSNTSINGGEENIATGYRSSICGGASNQTTGGKSAILGGANNYTISPYAALVGGTNNVASGDYSVVSGGYDNTASGTYSVVSGGEVNEASGNSSTIGGGANGSVSGAADWRAGTLFEEN